MSSPTVYQAVVTLLLLAAAGPAADPPERQVQPYFNARSHQTQYSGPTATDANADQLETIRIGYFGPSDDSDPDTGPLWRAAQRAVAEANRQGGFEGKPFQLLPAWSIDPWGTGVKDLTKLVYRDQVWAIVGGIDGPSTHLAEQVVAKARLPLVSPFSTDKTVNLANVPWMFSLAPGDHLIAATLAPEIIRRADSQAVVLITANDHDSFLLTRELRKELARARWVPQYQFEYKHNTTALNPLVDQCLATRPQTVIVLANASLSGQIVLALRQRGFTGLIAGGPNFGRSTFLAQTAREAGDVVFPVLVRTPSDHAGNDGDFAAASTYDAVRLVIAAIRTAGLNRVEIGRTIRELAPWQGSTGVVTWDGLGSNTRQPTLATTVEGRIVPLAVDEVPLAVDVVPLAVDGAD